LVAAGRCPRLALLAIRAEQHVARSDTARWSYGEVNRSPAGGRHRAEGSPGLPQTGTPTMKWAELFARPIQLPVRALRPAGVDPIPGIAGGEPGLVPAEAGLGLCLGPAALQVGFDLVELAVGMGARRF